MVEAPWSGGQKRDLVVFDVKKEAAVHSKQYKSRLEVARVNPETQLPSVRPVSAFATFLPARDLSSRDLSMRAHSWHAMVCRSVVQPVSSVVDIIL